MKVIIKKYNGNVANQHKTLARSVLLDSLISELSNASLETALNELKPIREVFLWDVGKLGSKHLDQGAILVVICGKNVYYGEILTLLYDEEGKIGDIVGWYKQFGAPWRNPVLLRNVRMIEVHLEETEDLLSEYDHTYVNKVYVLSGGEASTYLNTLGAKDSINKLSEKVTIDPVKEQTPTIPQGLQELINSIERLKKQDSHKERANEHLVADFLKYLGYKEFSDFNYQVGRMDLVLKVENIVIMTIEVKKSWAFGENIRTKAIEQAYGYSQKVGSRFVTITNGDNYEIFDRKQGLSYKDQKWYSFTLSRLTDEALSFLENNLRRRPFLKNLLSY